MKLVINGKETDLPLGQCIEDYLASRNLDPHAVVVELNEIIVPKDDYAGRVLAEGDRMEIVSFVGGG